MVYMNFENKKIISVSSESELQRILVNYLRDNHPTLLFTCTHTDSMLSNPQDRYNAKCLGYQQGLPDLYIFSKRGKYNGMAIELKNCWGNGEVSKEQNEILEKLDKEGIYCIVSNDLLDIINKLIKYDNCLL